MPPAALISSMASFAPNRHSCPEYDERAGHRMQHAHVIDAGLPPPISGKPSVPLAAATMRAECLMNVRR